jgi:uncharacterized lipoprotein
MQLKSILKIAATVIAAASVITLAGCGGDKDASALVNVFWTQNLKN